MSTEIEAYQQMTGFDQAQEKLLHEPLSAVNIEHRPGGGGKSLSYITGKTAIDTANRIFGFGKWGYRVTSRSCEKSMSLEGEVTGIFYTADIELYVIGNPFPFPGEGIGIVIPERSGITPQCHEKARKEAVTDALKRALRHYGDQFGLALYDEDALVEMGNGTMVKVKEVSQAQRQSNNQQQAKRVVDAPQPQRQIPAPQVATVSPTISKEAFKALYERGKEQGLFGNPAEFAEYVREALGLDVPIEFRSRMLTEDEEKDIQDSYRMRALQSAQARAKIAVAAQAS